MFSKSHLRYSVFLFVLSLFLSLSVNAVQAEVKVKFWHAMSGKRIELLKGMAEDFNKTHPGITVEAQYIGSYNETLNKTISAVKAGTAPHIFQLYEVGTRGMIDAGMIMPIGDLAKPAPVRVIQQVVSHVLLIEDRTIGGDWTRDQLHDLSPIDLAGGNHFGGTRMIKTGVL